MITEFQIEDFLQCMAFGFAMALILWSLGCAGMISFRVLRGAAD